jgi:hypothetical protein
MHVCVCLSVYLSVCLLCILVIWLVCVSLSARDNKHTHDHLFGFLCFCSLCVYDVCVSMLCVCIYMVIYIYTHTYMKYILVCICTHVWMYIWTSHIQGATVTVTVTVTDCLLKHELQKSSPPSPVVSRFLHRPVHMKCCLSPAPTPRTGVAVLCRYYVQAFCSWIIFDFFHVYGDVCNCIFTWTENVPNGMCICALTTDKTGGTLRAKNLENHWWT